MVQESLKVQLRALKEISNMNIQSPAARPEIQKYDRQSQHASGTTGDGQSDHEHHGVNFLSEAGQEYSSCLDRSTCLGGRKPGGGGRRRGDHEDKRDDAKYETHSEEEQLRQDHE